MVNYKKIIVFILTIVLLNTLSFAEEITIVDSASGIDFQLYLDDDGKVYGIGNNDQGELGLPDPEYDELEAITTGVLTPQIGVNLQKRTIAAGADFSVIIKDNKKAYATGENYFGQLATENTDSMNTFTEMKGTDENQNIVSVSAGADFVLLLNEDGVVYGAGENGFGQIKANGEPMYTTLTSVYTPSEDSKKAIAIAAGSRHSVILLANGTVVTLGDNEYHQRDVVAPGGKKIVEIAAGSYHTLILVEENGNNYSAWGVGNNENQQIAAHVGGGSILDQYRSTMVQLLDEKGKAIKVHNINTRIRSITAGFDFSLVVANGKDDKLTVIGIGDKYRNQLGKEAVSKNSNSVKIETMDTIKNIDAGWRHSVIIGKDKNNDKTESKGDKFYGEVEVGKPIKDGNVKTIAMGAGHTLYVKDDVLYGAGANAYGQLGVATYSSSVRKIPFDVKGVGGIKQIVTGAAHSVILGFDGSVWVTGYNYSGQLGLGDNKDRKSFTKLEYQFDSPVISVAAGGDVTMILTQKGTVYAMGDNSYKQINNSFAADTPKSYNTPYIYLQDKNVISIAAGSKHTLAVWGTGMYTGRGEGKYYSAYGGMPNVKKVVSGPYHSLVLLNDGTVKAVGKNTNGQLGIGSTSTGVVNGEVLFCETKDGANITVEVKDIAAGYAHSVFLTDKGIFIAGKIDGETDDKTRATKYINANNPQEIAAGWLGNIVKTANSIITIGNNVYGQRGSHRGEESSDYDDNIANLSKKKIAAGTGYTMVLHSDGTLWGIGKNDKGQLGTGDNVDRTTFVKINTPIAVGNIVDIHSYSGSTVLLTRNGELYVAGDIFGYTSNKFIKTDINNVKKIFSGNTRFFILKNDGSLWCRGDYDMGEGISGSIDAFERVPVELNENEYISNVYVSGTFVKIKVSGNGDRAVGSSSVHVDITDTKVFCEGGAFRLTNDNLYTVIPANLYESGDAGIVHMVTTEGTNELINQSSNNLSEKQGKPFSNGSIESVAAASDHVVVLTKSGEIYSAGSNEIGTSEYGLLGNDTLNNNNIKRTRVFVPTYIQSIAPTVGGVVK